MKTGTSWTQNADEIERLNTANDALVAALEFSVAELQNVERGIAPMRGDLSRAIKSSQAALAMAKGVAK